MDKTIEVMTGQVAVVRNTKKYEVPNPQAYLTPHEESVYFRSEWYQRKMAAKRLKLIATGWITPEEVVRVIVSPVIH